MADLNIRIGQTIQTQDGREGTVRYIGPIHLAAGEWLGLELADDGGKNDGSVKGHRYFQCAPGYGIFVRKESAVHIVKQAAQPPKSNGVPNSNGATAKPRPSSGVTADIARKRQSLMSSSSGPAAGSRLSLRSPTKSPTKPGPSSVSSTTSTPRTGTPATTTRTSDSSTKSRLSTTGKSLMGPPTSTTRASAAANRPSMGGPVKPLSARPTSMQPRPSLSGSRASMAPKTILRSEKADSIHPSLGEQQSSPPQDQFSRNMGLNNVEIDEAFEATEPDVKAPASRPHSTASPRSDTNNAPEDRSRQAQVIKALETKVRTLQKQRQEDQAQIQHVQDLQNQTTRYEGIIQALQKKLKSNQQEMQDLKAKYEDAESRAGKVPNRSAEHESELELATLDKEMAEERADMFETELEALKLKHEELELEVEILREENRELASVMSPEEKASAGWLQMERETERLRQALVMLRDMSQQNEGDLRNEIKELQETLDELEQTASKYEEVVAKLARSEETNEHLREQLEAAEANDDILEAMGAERDQNRNVIELLKRQIQDLEEHIQVTDELEAFHVEEEKRLHYQLDESEAILNDKHRQTVEQEKTIEDLEYTLTKFRDMVQGLQNDIDELRRSRDVSELEAHEMNSKSRAMMDLNLKLQSSAAKTQLKAIDLELGKMRAEQASLHLEIVQLFVPDTFEVDKKPILALLCFKRIKSKAQLSKNILAERIRDRPDLHDNPMSVFATMEQLHFIANVCERFVQHLSTCSTDSFAKYAGAPFELEPVEQAVTGWVEALRRDELAHEGSGHLHRMAGILVDMAEKLLSESYETKSMELLASISMTENYADNAAHQAQIISKAVQTKLGGANDEDEESMLFEKRMDQLGIKARTIKYVSGKVVHALSDLRARSMCPAESMWNSLSEVELCAERMSQVMQHVGQAVIEDLHKIDREEAFSYSRVIQLMTTAAQQRSEPQTAGSDDVFDMLSKQLQTIQSKIDGLNTQSADISGAIEFEKLPAPWIARAREAKAQKVLSQDLQEEMARLKLRIQEQTIRLSEKDKQLEEQQVKVEILESRAKETKAKDDGVKAMKDEIEKLRSETHAASENLQKLEGEYQTLLEARESQRMEMEALKRRSVSDGQGGLVLDAADETTSVRFKAEVDLLKVEIASLQASVRFLKYENRQLRIPVNEIGKAAVENHWLDPSRLTLATKDDKLRPLRTESKDVLTGLIEMAKSSKPVKLKARSGYGPDANGPVSSWRAESDTTLYQVLQRKEELERWNEMKDDLVQRARIMVRSSRPVSERQERPINQKKPFTGTRRTGPVKAPALEEVDELELGSAVNVDGVRVVRY
ncbi:uncharacterized protein Z518_03658 [Rhinocladiella mackenziei CBS 650.93]|uniref:Rhinocladiella mackenziei CBS 650.93 unplaced genomic scaffold supercont1.3, whole genome shotgun sequence n=1 Tax=Rhinocladiella mackenziei CBS 650.93 TaxID=1442369 RepID=A0A0D2IR97_9EURO|nr:uncharacterized protein Z518_03658 [Rhinocladiella mackenziei CBS 650.93]KIX05686.1 hypothetical protein Z518_03658 [Rhinocladiella mackenziei CBS 650.93]